MENKDIIFKKLQNLVDQLKFFGVDSFINNITISRSGEGNYIYPSIIIAENSLDCFAISHFKNLKLSLYFKNRLGSPNRQDSDDIDAEILPLCEAIWSLNAKTLFSCAGHDDDGAYVTIDLTSINRIESKSVDKISYLLVEFSYLELSKEDLNFWS